MNYKYNEEKFNSDVKRVIGSLSADVTKSINEAVKDKVIHNLHKDGYDIEDIKSFNNVQGGLVQINVISDDNEEPVKSMDKSIREINNVDLSKYGIPWAKLKKR